MYRLSTEEAVSHLNALPRWRIEKGELTRTFDFKDFKAALAFVNLVGDVLKRPVTTRTLIFATTACAWLW
jgi:pterin-4a-carbinolamine dehydratase